MRKSSIVLNPFFNFLSEILRAALFSTMRKDTRSEVRKIKKGDPTIFQLPPLLLTMLSSVYIFFLSFSSLLLRIDLGG